MKKFELVFGYLTKLNKHKAVERFEISAADNDDAFNQLEANLRNYRGKTKANRIYGKCINEEKELIRIQYDYL